MNALTLTDIAAQAFHETLVLDWVGMCGIALPISIEKQRVSAKIEAGVSVDDVSARAFTCPVCIWAWKDLNKTS